MSEAEVFAFLSFLAVTRRVSASTQNQAFNALVFLYKQVLERPFKNIHGIVCAKTPRRIPIVFTREEVRAIFSHLDQPYHLIASLLYGSGLRLIIERAMERVHAFHQQDLAEGYGTVQTPYALEKKYPSEAKSLRWQFLFAAPRLSVDPVTGHRRRHHLYETNMQRAVKGAMQLAGVHKKGSCYTFRHPFATHLLKVSKLY